MSIHYAAFKDRLEAWSDIQGHLEFLYETVLKYSTSLVSSPIVIELGIREGNSTSALLAAVSGTAGGQLWSVDKDAPAVPDTWRDSPHWHVLTADDLHPTATAWAPAQCDVLFIDTSHTYDHTLAELRIYGPRVRPGGTILAHDTQLVDGNDAGHPDGDVAKALTTWCGETGLEWSNRPGSYGLGVISVG